MKKGSKKGDLSLSTNAIVILILAITILGLGLTFVRGVFKEAQSKIIEVTSSTELANPPTRDNPMTISPTQLSIREKDVGKVLVAYLNTHSGEDEDTCTLEQTALPSGDDVGDFKVSSTSVKMQQDKINVWTIAFIPKKPATPQDADWPLTGLYTLKMKCTPSEKETTKDIIVTVNP